MNAILIWGVVFTNSDGYEKYQEFQTQIEELFSIKPQADPDASLFLVTDLKINIINFYPAGNGLEININCQYSLKTYINQLIKVIEDNSSPELIYATTLVGHESFSLQAEEVFTLRCSPLRVEGIKTKLLQVKSEVKNGWLGIHGFMEVEISYIDREHIFREDVFKRCFQENFIWDKLHDQMDVIVEGKLDYDTYDLRNTDIGYKYLLSFSVEAFKEQELRIGTLKNPTESIIQSLDNSQNEYIQPPSLYTLLIEGEVPLKHGKVREIIANRALISQFDYQKSHNAILVKGNLHGELDYWDDKQYLQQDTINLPFWRFIPNDFGLGLAHCKLIPEVTNYSCIPSKTRLWWKGSVKIRFELEFKSSTMEGEVF